MGKFHKKLNPRLITFVTANLIVASVFSKANELDNNKLLVFALLGLIVP